MKTRKEYAVCNNAKERKGILIFEMKLRSDLSRNIYFLCFYYLNFKWSFLYISNVH